MQKGDYSERAPELFTKKKTRIFRENIFGSYRFCRFSFISIDVHINDMTNMSFTPFPSGWADEGFETGLFELLSASMYTLIGR